MFIWPHVTHLYVSVWLFQKLEIYLLTKTPSFMIHGELYLFILKPFLFHNGQGAWVAQWARSLDLTAHTSLSPIWHGFVPSFVNYKKGCTRLAAASDKVYQLLVQGRWFSLASFTTKTGRHDNIAEILLKVVLKHQKIKINHNGQNLLLGIIIIVNNRLQFITHNKLILYVSIMWKIFLMKVGCIIWDTQTFSNNNWLISCIKQTL